MRAVFQVGIGQNGFRELAQLGGVGDVAGFDGGLAGDRVQGLVAQTLGAVQPAATQVLCDLGEGGGRVGFPNIRRDLPQQQVALPQVVQVVAQAQQQVAVLEQDCGFLLIEGDGAQRL